MCVVGMEYDCIGCGLDLQPCYTQVAQRGRAETTCPDGIACRQKVVCLRFVLSLTVQLRVSGCVSADEGACDVAGHAASDLGAGHQGVGGEGVVLFWWLMFFDT